MDMTSHKRTRGWSDGLVTVSAALCIGLVSAPASQSTTADSLLRTHLLVTHYGNPHSMRMGVLGTRSGAARADALRAQALAYAPLTPKRVLPAYHLVAVVAQPSAGADGMFRRRESAAVIRDLLTEARANGFHLVLDVQPGRAQVADELAALRPFLMEPDVHLALDPEFDMGHGQIPGRELGSMPATEISQAATFLSEIIRQCDLPPKVLIVHQFAVRMLPDVRDVRAASMVDVVLTMDGFGSQSLKLASYRTVMRRWPLEFAGIKLFYTVDTHLFTPEQVLDLSPLPSVVIYQ